MQLNTSDNPARSHLPDGEVGYLLSSRSKAYAFLKHLSSWHDDPDGGGAPRRRRTSENNLHGVLLALAPTGGRGAHELISESWRLGKESLSEEFILGWLNAIEMVAGVHETLEGAPPSTPRR